MPCKTEEDTKVTESAVLAGPDKAAAAHSNSEETVKQPVEGEHNTKPEAKEETPVDPESTPPVVEGEPKRETPLAADAADTDMAAAPVQLQGETVEPAPATGQAVEPVDRVNPDDQRRHEDDGRVHLGMALQDIICDSKSMKDVLAVAAARVGRINAETARAKMELRKSLTKGAEQAWISLWHLVFRSKRVHTQSVKVLVKAHRADSTWSHWDLNEAFFHAFHTMQSGLASLTALWEEVQPLVEMTKNQAKQTWEAILLAANLPSRADINKVTFDQEGKAVPDSAKGSGSASGSASAWLDDGRTPSKAMPQKKHLVPPPPKSTGDTSDSEETSHDEACEQDNRTKLKTAMSRRAPFSPGTQYATYSRFGLLEKIERKAKRRKLENNAPWSAEGGSASLVGVARAAGAPWRDDNVCANAMGIPPPPSPRRMVCNPTPPPCSVPRSFSGGPTGVVIRPCVDVPLPPPPSVSQAKLAIPVPPGCYRTSNGSFKKVPVVPKQRDSVNCDLPSLSCCHTKALCRSNLPVRHVAARRSAETRDHEFALCSRSPQHVVCHFVMWRQWSDCATCILCLLAHLCATTWCICATKLLSVVCNDLCVCDMCMNLWRQWSNCLTCIFCLFANLSATIWYICATKSLSAVCDVMHVYDLCMKSWLGRFFHYLATCMNKTSETCYHRSSYKAPPPLDWRGGAKTSSTKPKDKGWTIKVPTGYYLDDVPGDGRCLYRSLARIRGTTWQQEYELVLTTLDTPPQPLQDAWYDLAPPGAEAARLRDYDPSAPLPSGAWPGAQAILAWSVATSSNVTVLTTLDAKLEYTYGPAGMAKVHLAYNGQHYRPILPDSTSTCSFVRELPRQPRPDRVHNKLLNTGLRKMELMAS
eukprot:832276-Amphidinium_carterae.1